MSHPPMSVRTLLVVLWLAGSAGGNETAADLEGQARMYAYLQSRADYHPGDPSAWRTLGAFLLQQGDFSAAAVSFSHAIRLDGTSASAHYGLGQCLLQLGAPAAARHLLETIRLAPESDYAREAAATLQQIPAPPQILPVNFDVKRLDGSDTTADLVDSAMRNDAHNSLFLSIDLGATYNSNVTLTPIARNFSAAERESAQAFFNPVLEYRLIDDAFWRIGPSFTGYFSINENNAFSSLNLQSYQPGFFVERTVCCPTTILVPSLHYDYTLDEFDGATFGNRHAITASITSLWDNGDTSVLYWSTNHTDFADDGADPRTASRDGWTHTVGLSHSWPVAWRFVRLATVGGDLEWAAVEGSDFAYFGGGVYAGIEIPLTGTMWCELEAGCGLRDYYNSTVSPSRNEVFWRGSAKITKRLTERWQLIGVYTSDVFESENTLFEAERHVAGLVARFEY